MKMCEHNCKASCMFCIHSRRGGINEEGTNVVVGCTANLDEEHQIIAINNLGCDDFHCYEAELQ